MTPFTVYDADTGEIAWSGNCQDSLVDAQASEARQAATNQASSPGAQYVDLSGDTPVIADRMAMSPSVSTSTDQAEITNLPDPCEIRWNGQSAEATGGTATVTFDEPGTHTLTLRAAPAYLDRTLEVVIP